MNKTLAAYALPEQVSKGVWLELDRAPVKFLVKLPSRLNRAFMTTYNRIVTRGAQITKAGEVDMSGVDFQDALDGQTLAFFETCIIECDAPDVVIATLWDDYPEVVSELFDKAMELAEQHGEEIETQTEKPAAS